jgi:hypothetical protein
MSALSMRSPSFPSGSHTKPHAPGKALIVEAITDSGARRRPSHGPDWSDSPVVTALSSEVGRWPSEPKRAVVLAANVPPTRTVRH